MWEFSTFKILKPRETDHNAVVGITIFIQAMIAFFGILNLDESHATKVSPLTKGGMRGAITGAVVVTLIFLWSFFIPWWNSQQEHFADQGCGQGFDHRIHSSTVLQELFHIHNYLLLRF